jgi:hypothetical protein
MHELDFLICSIPRMNMMYPPPAPALLKSVLTAKNYRCKTKDFVSDFYHTFKNHPEWTKIDNWNALPNYNNKEIGKIISDKVKQWAEELVEYKSEWIGVSIFSYESHKIGKLLAEKIKIKDSSQKIFFGGAGITNVNIPYPETLLEQGIIDAFITGEGEQSIIELAKNNIGYPGINDRNFVKIEKKIIDTLPMPDYTDYDLSLYGKQNLGVYKDLNQRNNLYVEYENTLPITGSKGCVRRCSYCDVPFLWPKFTHRGGLEVANEIIEKSKKYDVRKFHFTDSLVNGSMKEFRILCDTLAKNNRDTNNAIIWSGQFIFRPNRQHTPEDWELIARSGGSVLEVGLESASDDIRFAMGKKFTNDDIAYELYHCQKNMITTFPLMIVGYPTETDEHYQQYIEFFKRFHQYAYDKTILSLELGGTLRIQPNTPDDVNLPAIGIEMIPMPDGSREDLLWWNPNNPDLTFSKRIWRRFTLGKIAKDLGYQIPADDKDLKYLWSKWNQLKDIESNYLYERKNKN